MKDDFIYTKWVCSCKPAYGKIISSTSAGVYVVQGHDSWFHSKRTFLLILGTSICIVFFFSFHIISTCWILTMGLHHSNGFLLPCWWLQTVFQFWYVLNPISVRTTDYWANSLGFTMSISICASIWACCFPHFSLFLTNDFFYYVHPLSGWATWARNFGSIFDSFLEFPYSVSKSCSLWSNISQIHQFIPVLPPPPPQFSFPLEGSCWHLGVLWV